MGDKDPNLVDVIVSEKTTRQFRIELTNHQISDLLKLNDVFVPVTAKMFAGGGSIRPDVPLIIEWESVEKSDGIEQDGEEWR